MSDKAHGAPLTPPYVRSRIRRFVRIVSLGIPFSSGSSYRIPHILAECCCRQLLRELSASPFSHLVLDIMLADGSALEVMVFSGQPAALYRKALVRYRINYVLSKGMSERETMELLRQFLHNEHRIADTVIKKDLVAGRYGDAPIPFAGMPAREIDVLQYMLKGWRTGQIAETLNLSVSTVSTLKSRIFERTQTSNIKELMDLAMLHQVITL